MALLLITGCDQQPPDAGQLPPPARSEPGHTDRNPADAAVPVAEEMAAGRNATAPATNRSNLTETSAPESDVSTESVPEIPSAVPPRAPLRMADNRPALNEQQLREAGIEVYRSDRLILLSDAPAEAVADLPSLADELFGVLENVLGTLPAAADGSDFQVTGCLISARERFESQGLMPEADLVIRHGRHLDYRFWMFDPPSDYYRRHLLLHEFVHCFMTCEHGMSDIPPLWYTEGIAEFFATHRLAERAGEKAQFGVLPQQNESFFGWGRISEIQRSFSRECSQEPLDAGLTTLDAVLHPATNLFQQDTQYAHAWALVWFLNRNATYQKAFSDLRSVRSHRQFQEVIRSIPQATWRSLAVDWLLTLDSLTEGFDTARSFPQREPETDFAVIRAAGGWQFSGRQFQIGQRVSLLARGRFSVAQDPRPWISEPQGITIDYHRGRPLGELVAMLVALDGSRATRRIPVGTGTEMTMPFDGELWLQLNDSAASRLDNDGHVTVEISVHQQTSEQ